MVVRGRRKGISHVLWCGGMGSMAYCCPNCMCQCLYYLTLGILLAILIGTRVSRMSLVYFFDYATVTTSTVTGCSVISSIILSYLVGRLRNGE